MTCRIRIAVTLSALLALGGCGEPAPEVRRSQVLALGTVVELSLYGADARRAGEARARVRELLKRFDRRWSAWGDGALGRANAALAAGRAARLEAGMSGPIRRALELQRASGGRFNPLMGRLTELWGFHTEAAADSREPPAAEALAALVPAPGPDELAMRDGRLVPARPLRIDLGGFAKGLAVDRAMRALAGMGIDEAIVNAGGDLRVSGRPGDRHWRIGVRDPRGSGILASLEVHDGESVFTSGDYERYFTHGGRRYHHILDPATGRPARNVRSVTVIGDDAAAADAAATALFVAGPGAWLEVAGRLGLERAMLLDAEGRLHMTPAMSERLRLEAERPPTVLVSDTP